MLRQTIERFVHLKDSEFNRLWSRFKVKDWPKKAVILAEGEVCKGVYFVNTGLVGHYLNQDGMLTYEDFYPLGSFATIIGSLTSQRASDQGLVALQATQTAFIARTDLLALYEEAPVFQEFGRLLLESLLTEMTERTSLLKNRSARERYALLLDKRPELIQQVPLQYLSSYLGMSRETLSRMRKGKG